MSSDFHLMTSFIESSNLSRLPDGRFFAVDCNMFSGRFNEVRWLNHLNKILPYSEKCLFVVAPDALNITPVGVVGDAKATLEKYPRYRTIIKDLGYPVAFVAQDGMDYPIPECDWFFIGGSTKFKYSDTVRGLVSECKNRGIKVHMGRVNTPRRIAYCKHLGIDSVDGTHSIFRPDRSLKQLNSWMEQELLI